MGTDEGIQIAIEGTPNPNSLKYSVNRAFLKSGGMDFATAAAAKESALAEKLFGLDWVRGVFVGTHFVTVTKSNETDWNEVAAAASDVIREVLASGIPVVQQVSEATHEGADSVVKKINTILDQEIRPAVAMDGGDITFISYKDGILQLNLRGACSSCPSSVMTLRMGVEQRLRQEIPELKEVVHI